jgi:virginiamycin A acetyltransferase
MLSIDESSYIMQPYRIESHGSRKADGELPIITIGKKCSIAANITFVLSNHLMNRFTTHPSPVNLFPHGKGATTSYSKGDIIIKSDVWIGTNVTLIDGITIGNGAVIAAGSVVVKDVPPYAIVGGNPAKILKYRFSPEIINEIEKTGFWDLPIEDINRFNIHTDDIKSLIKEIKHFKTMSYVNYIYKLKF